MFKLPRAPDALPPQRDFQRFFLVQTYSFAAIGIDPTSLERTTYHPWRTWIPILSIVTVFGPVFVYTSKCADGLYQVAHILTPILQSILAVVKISLFMWNRKKIVHLVRNIWLWNLEANDIELKILTEENHYHLRVSVFYFGSVIVSGIMLSLLPVVIAAFLAWKGHSFWDSLDTPFKGVYIMDIHQSYFAYVFAFVWNILGIYFVVNGTLAVDTLFSWFMRNISGQFRIVNFRFKSMADRVTALKSDPVDFEEEFLQSLIECVKYHRKVIELSDSLNEVYKHIVFFKFLISCVQIAFVTFQFPNTSEIVVQLLNVSFMLSISTQLMLYCHGGQRIKDLSISIDSTIYEYFQWHKLSVKSQKLLQLPIIRSQKACHLKGLFFVADLGLFVWVFKSAGSFMMMMLSVYQAEEV